MNSFYKKIITFRNFAGVRRGGGDSRRFLKSIFIQKRQRLISLLWSVIMVEYSFLN